MGDGLAAHQSPLVEEPLVLAVELLEAVVREDHRVGLVRDLQHESVAATNGAGGRAHELVRIDGGVERGDLGLVDAMPERRVDDNGHRVVGMLVHERTHGLVKLFEARIRASLGGDVRSVDDDVSGEVWSHGGPQSTILDPAVPGTCPPTVPGMDDPTGEVTALLQQMISNACVNDGTPESGRETVSADLLATYLEGTGLDLERFEAVPGRANLVARIEGSDPAAPSLLLMGHTDVVPVTPERWRHDPFGGELIDGEVWGRGAVDMLNLTASMAVAFKHLASSGFKPKGTLIYLGVADEEALGTYGADYLVANERDHVVADYVITEAGGFPMDLGAGVRLPVIVGEKGTFWSTLRVTGTPGHASMPLRTDNALVKAAEVVRRLAEYQPETQIHDTWRRFVEDIGLPQETVADLLDPDRLVALCDELPLAMAREFHACTHTTFAPTIIHGGTKTNVIPDTIDLTVDIRTLPGQGEPEVRAMLGEALGDLSGAVELVSFNDDGPTSSPIDTPMWDAMDRVSKGFYPDAKLVPFLTVGGTDARFFRRAGSAAYGFGLFSRNMSFEDYGVMFHGDDERVDQESLRLSTEMWHALAIDFLG